MAVGNGATKIGVWLSIATAAAILIGSLGGMFYVAFITKSNADAIITLERTIHDQSDKISSLQDRLTKIEVSQNEVETQFCGMDTVRNLIHASDLRISSLLWEKVFGTKYPTDNAFYPVLCNRRIKQ